MADTAQPVTDNRERKTARRHRAPNGPGMFITDGELVTMLGVPDDIARQMIAELDRRGATTGFPQKQKQWGDRRYLPAVKAWLDQRYMPKMTTPPIRRVS